MPIDLEQVARVANVLGLPAAVGVAAAYARTRFTDEGRRSRVARELAALSDPNLVRVVGDDPPLAQATEERRRALAFALLLGFPAHAAERAVVLAFREERRGRYTDDELRAARRLLRWLGRAYAARSTRADRVANGVLRYSTFTLALLSVIAFPAGVLAGVSLWSTLYSLAIMVLAVTGARQLSLEHQAQRVADDLQHFSEAATLRDVSSARAGDAAVGAGSDGSIHPRAVTSPAVSSGTPSRSFSTARRNRREGIAEVR